jgi:hypothetical protein
MDKFFNQDAATWAYETVMKMDDASAREFITHVTYQALQADIAGNRRAVDRRIAQVHDEVSKAAARVVAKGELSPALVAEQVSKAFGDDEFNRDKRGRFASVESRVRTDRTKAPLTKVAEKAQGIPSAKKVTQESGFTGHKLSAQERSAYQQQYTQLLDFLDKHASSGGANPQMVLQDRSTGRQRMVNVSNDAPHKGWNPARQDLVAVRGTLPDSPAAHASFDLVSSLAGPGAGNAAADGVERTDRSMPLFAERWTDASGDAPGSTDRAYRRIAAGSQLLGQVAPTSSTTAQAAAAFGQFVGSHGPEAEKVIGPYMRKTTYRYRGIERKPDSELITARNAEVLRVTPPQEDQSVAQIAARRVGGDSGVSPEQKSQASARAVTAYLMNPKHLPTLRLSEIQRKSGRIPPSEGVIIDKDGKIAVQAVGHSDDHYLPFNLKNLRALRGGQYVRNRTKGGLTTEDIYTGLVSGARQATVVSNSGVFTITFADDFRGVRRYNDKAATMVDRYAKTLDAIKEGQIEREPIDPRVKAEIRESVESDMPRTIYSPKEVEEAVKSKLDEYRQSPTLTSSELDAIDAQARKGSKNEPDYKRLRSQMSEQLLEDRRSRFYQLDGEGYAAALESLREQYPYYIQSVSFMHRREAMNNQGERTDPEQMRGTLTRFAAGDDKGYVKARYNRPDAVETGFYDTEIGGPGEKAGSGKVAASHTHYQNWENNPQRRAAKHVAEQAEPENDSQKATPLNARQEWNAVKAQAAAKENEKAATKKLVEHFTGADLKGGFPALESARTDFDAVWMDEIRRRQLVTDLEGLTDNLARQTGTEGAGARQMGEAARPLMASLKYESGLVGGAPFNAEKIGTVASDSPYSFSEPAYQLGADKALASKEIDRVTSRLRLTTRNTFNPDATDDQLAQAAMAAGRASKLLSNGQATTNEGSLAIAQAMTQLGMPDQVGFQLISQMRQSKDMTAEAKRYAEAAQDIERFRRLKVNGATATTVPVAAPEPPKGLPASAAPLPSGPEMSEAQIVTELRNVASHLDKAGKNAHANHYYAIAEAMDNGDYESAAKQAAKMVSSETDDVRKFTLRKMFPDMDYYTED